MMRLSPHFSIDELKCRCSRHGKEPYCYIAPRLLSLGERARDVLSTAMIVTSACRCPEHNSEVGGVANSYHIGTPDRPALAMDFKPKGLLLDFAFNALVRAWYEYRLTELGGIGIYDTFIHIDTVKAADGHLRVWDERASAPDLILAGPRLKIPADIAGKYGWTK